MSLIDEITDFMNDYPILWVAYPILLLFPIALLTALLVPRQKQHHPDQPQTADRTLNTSGDRVRAHKGVKPGDQSDGDNSNQKKRNNVHYLVRGSNAGLEEEEEQSGLTQEEEMKWNFPPNLEEFNLMDLDVDPAMIEEIFNDRRLIQVVVRLSAGQGLGLTIVGGKDSVSGDAPIYMKRVLGGSVLQKEGKLKTGDELIAVNDVLLVNATKEYASSVLTNVEGCVRLLAIQDL